MITHNNNKGNVYSHPNNNLNNNNNLTHTGQCKKH